MRIVVDTGVFSASVSRRRRERFESQVASMAGNQVFLAAVTVAELRYGALVAGWGPPRRERLERVIETTTVVPVTDPDDSSGAALRLPQGGSPAPRPRPRERPVGRRVGCPHRSAPAHGGRGLRQHPGALASPLSASVRTGVRTSRRQTRSTLARAGQPAGDETAGHRASTVLTVSER